MPRDSATCAASTGACNHLQLETNSPQRPRLRLRCLLDLGLLSEDRRRLEAFMAVGSKRLAAKWSMFDAAPLDASICDIDRAAPAPSEPGRGGERLVLSRVPGTAPNTDPLRLLAPLQFDEVVCALGVIEARLSITGTTPDPATPTFAPPPVATQAQLPARLNMGHRFRLRRWPSVVVLIAHPDGHRIAPFLSSRALTVSELSGLSGIPQARCRDFLNQLMNAALLRIEPILASGTAPAPVASRRSPGSLPLASSPPSRATGLLSRLRQRLGLSIGTNAPDPDVS